MKQKARPKKKEQIPYIIQQIPAPQPHFTPHNNVSTATFSSHAKQAESLVNGDISIQFSHYNNHILFKSKHGDMNDCVNIDVIHRKLQNITGISFDNNSEIKGISDGYTTNKQGVKVPLYDKNVALSTVFAYEYQHKIDSVRRDLNSEIEKRKYADELLNNRVTGVESDIKNLDNEVDVLKSTIADMDSQIKALESAVTGLNNEVSDLQSTVSDMDSHIKSLETELATAKNNIQSLTETCTDYQARISQLERLTRHFVIPET